MKACSIILTACLGLAISCGRNTDQATQSESPAASPECYAYRSGKDSVLLKFRSMGQQVKGTLSYHYFEKDKSKGSIEGRFRGDTLFATYTFFSEGTESIREVAFLSTGKGMVPGYGTMQEQDGKMIFVQAANLDFDYSVRLAKEPCSAP